ncbi:hypothetical protein FNV43_RR12621 [Rhamnella rubrinervis]|uniref:DOG1 domain-containing protein n=1 Tax=Rhamnella rubrinervis TaxID=2594499 RepID=A0A8K0H8N1_9ROSA|nr:hypothetical protein FNV43_RR11708 [Rhamnella rubrinervis]KAF3447435.1 hypothetical protein FNV43_RR12621 [Rhamnella rubrinervis]
MGSHPILSGRDCLRERFQIFFDGWLQRQQSFLDQLLLVSACPDSHEKVERQRTLVDQVLSHYQEYYEEKARTAWEDVFTVFSAPWLSPFERTFLWIGGFKPLFVLRLVSNVVGGDLTSDQSRVIERLKQETSQAERELNEMIAKVQESVAAPPLLASARRLGRLMDGRISNLEEAIETLKNAMLRVLESADELRWSMVRKVIEVLSPDQTVKFLVAAAEFQLRMRRWGLQGTKTG